MGVYKDKDQDKLKRLSMNQLPNQNKPTLSRMFSLPVLDLKNINLV